MQNKKKILVIDDEEDICFSTKSVLEKTDKFEVIFATKAREGIGLAKSHRPDLILLDIMMPDMDGAEVANLLCEDESTKGITTVFLTALAIPMTFLGALVENEDLKQRAGQIGGHYFITKPVTNSELVNRIEDILSEKK